MEGKGFTPFMTIERIHTRESVTKAGDGPMLERAAEKIGEVTPEMIKERFSGQTTLIYDVKVKAVGESGAIKRAKGLVRSKNLFEPSSLDTIHVMEKDEAGFPKTFMVTIGVEK